MEQKTRRRSLRTLMQLDNIAQFMYRSRYDRRL